MNYLIFSFMMFAALSSSALSPGYLDFPYDAGPCKITDATQSLEPFKGGHLDILQGAANSFITFVFPNENSSVRRLVIGFIPEQLPNQIVKAIGTIKNEGDTILEVNYPENQPPFGTITMIEDTQTSVIAFSCKK